LPALLPRLLICALLTPSVAALAQDKIRDEPQKGFNWQLDFAAATFLGNDSYFGESVGFNGANTDDWTEAAAELGFQAFAPLGQGTFFTELSGLVSRTWGDDASGLTVGLSHTHETDIEQAHIGWRSGSTFASLDVDALTLKAGNFDYLVGSGLLIADGTSDGGPRGGWFLSPRRAFRESFMARLKSAAWKLDGFYLHGEGRTDDVRTYGYGGDFEYGFADTGLNMGLLYIKVPDQTVSDGNFRQRYESLSLRGDWAASDELSFAGEYVYQSRTGAKPRGWYLKGAYQWSESGWTPEISYRYAHFDGDDIYTAENEGYEPVAYGFTDYGTWVQGEISGNYPLGNSNLKSHMLRLQLYPNKDLVLNIIYYDFALDQPNIFGDPVGSTDWGDELNLAVDYPITDKWLLNATVGWLVPGQAAINWTGGDKTWVYGMLYMSFSL
jgi:hypothetical protein